MLLKSFKDAFAYFVLSGLNYEMLLWVHTEAEKRPTDFLIFEDEVCISLIMESSDFQIGD